MERIAVLYGGRSAEREISIKTGDAVAKAIGSLGYTVEKIDTKDDFIDALKEFMPDLVFIALHGPYGEDGTIQGLLEILNYPYTGCGVLTSALTMNKIYTKKILLAEGIPTPSFKVVSEIFFKEQRNEVIDHLLETIRLPMVIKAPCQGSTIGVYFAKQKEDIGPMIEKAFSYEKEILIEKHISGKEITVAVMGNEDKLDLLPAIEIVSHTGVYDFEAKYTKGLSDHIIPARLPDSVLEKIYKIAEDAYKAVGCRGFSRVDFMVENDIDPYVLEINTIPGMTETSLFPDAAQSAGISFEALIQKFIFYALEDRK